MQDINNIIKMQLLCRTVSKATSKVVYSIPVLSKHLPFYLHSGYFNLYVFAKRLNYTLY